MKTFFIYFFKSILSLLTIACLFFSLTENTFKVSKNEIQSNIDSYLFNHGGSTKVKDFTIKSINVSSLNDNLILSAKVDFEKSYFKFYDQEITGTILPTIEDNKVFIEIKDFDSAFLNSENFKKQVVDNINKSIDIASIKLNLIAKDKASEKINNLYVKEKKAISSNEAIKTKVSKSIDKATEKINIVVKVKSEEKINKILEEDKERIKTFILNSIQKHTIKVYEFKSKFIILIGMNVISEKDTFYINVKYQLHDTFIFIGFLLIMLLVLFELYLKKEKNVL